MAYSWLLAVVVAFVVVSVVIAAIRPLRFAQQHQTRQPTADEYDSLTGSADGIGRVQLRLIEQSASSPRSRARAWGIVPGSRYLFVAERLLGELSAPALSAIVAHELHHLRRWHPLGRVVLPAIFLIGWAWAIVVAPLSGLVGGAVLVAPYWLMVMAIERWMERRADIAAAEQVGYEAMVEALRHLDETSDEQSSGRIAWLASHPTFAERIAHLEAEYDGEPVDNAKSTTDGGHHDRS